MRTDVPLSQVFSDAGQKILSSSGVLEDTLNRALNELLPWPFRATTGLVRGSDGQETEAFGTVINAAASQTPSQVAPSILGTGNVACVIDVYENLDIESLRGAYLQIAAAKRLKKAVATNMPGVPVTTITLGIMFARDTTLPIELLAEELDRLNTQYPDREWTDMLVVLSKGIVNYAVQFPGEGVTGDFLPPSEGALDRYSPPIYVIMVLRPTGRFTFNKMCYFVLGHLMFFSPGAKLANSHQLLEGVPQDAITITGYQYNLNVQLRPVPREFYNDRYLPPRPFLIEDAAGNLLSTVQFIPWQDGGVVLLKGKLPLAPLLIFLGKDALKRGGVVKRPDGEISYVLPIGEADFRRMLQGIQSRSNMNVRADPSRLVLQKVMDEGTSSPLIARLYVGIFRLRDVVFPDHRHRDSFDTPYGQILEALANTRTASRRISQLVAGHLSKVARGELGRMRGRTIYVDEAIDDELRKEVESFLNSAVRALKSGMQAITEALGKDIGFLFQKQQSFEDGIGILKGSDRELAAYLTQSRQWSERLINSRNAVEHEGWILPKVSYSEVAGVVRADEPEIANQKVSEFISFIMDRLICFVEEVTVHCVVKRMPAGITVAEIPMAQRDPEVPLRFQLTPCDGGIPKWQLAYHQDSFDQT